MRLDTLDIPWGEGPFKFTKRISFELSNRCNFSSAHTKCPIHFSKETKILPESIFLSVVDSCKRFNFKGVIAFHLYNEPLHDPRLVYFMRLLKTEIPDIRIFILTNGWYLTEELAGELAAHGLDYLGISAYSQKDYERFRGFDPGIPVKLIYEKLDNRLDWYRRSGSSARSVKPCFCPLYELCITCEGELVLCPYDWKRKHIFGNLHQDALEDILKSETIEEVYHALSKGERKLTICKNCTTTRGEMKN